MKKPHYRCDRCDCSRYRVLSNKEDRICCFNCGFEGWITLRGKGN